MTGMIVEIAKNHDIGCHSMAEKGQATFSGVMLIEVGEGTRKGQPYHQPLYDQNFG